jgi:hypothetical protein
MTLMGDEPELGLGDSGEHVTQLQDRLRGLGLLDKMPDGTYDDATESAVRQMQSNLGKDNDGRVTPETWQDLDQHMLTNGLTYNHYAGPGNQHWDAQNQAGADPSADPAQAHEAHHVSEDGLHYWDGQAWQPTNADQPAAAEAHHEQAHAEAAGEPADLAGHNGQVAVGSVSPDGLWKWNGTDWESAGDAAAAPAAAEEAPPVIPHIDNIHPAIAADERFSDFHDFLRETHGGA